MLNSTLGLRDPSAAARYLGNGVYIVKLPGGSAGEEEGLQQGSAGEGEGEGEGERFEAAAALNAARVRQGVAGYRADAVRGSTSLPCLLAAGRLVFSSPQ